MSETPTPETIRHFWFGDIDDDARTATARAELWWRKSDDTDALIRARFADALRRAAAGELDTWAATPGGRLALIVLLDQFSRNIHRGTAAAFAQDARALALSVEGQELGHGRALRAVERVFLYMPMEHAEDGAMQERAVAAFRGLLDDVSPHQRQPFENFLDFAERHKAIIDRFGRFPHRNMLLGRESTAEEAAFLEQPGSRF